MADAVKVLAQSIPASTVLTDIYTVPAGVKAVLSTVMIANQSSTATTIRLSVAVAGAADATKQYLYYDVALPANDTIAATLGITLNATDVLRGYSLNGSVSFNVFGAEVV